MSLRLLNPSYTIISIPPSVPHPTCLVLSCPQHSGLILSSNYFYSNFSYPLLTFIQSFKIYFYSYIHLLHDISSHNTQRLFFTPSLFYLYGPQSSIFPQILSLYYHPRACLWHLFSLNFSILTLCLIIPRLIEFSCLSFFFSLQMCWLLITPFSTQYIFVVIPFVAMLWLILQ